MITSEAAPALAYTESLARGGVLLAETRALLHVWRPGESIADLTERVRGDDVLGKATARTVKDYVRAFARRFLSPTDIPASHLRVLIAASARRQVFSDLVFYYIAQQDFLLRDFTVLRYWPAVREGRLAISIQDVRLFIWEAEQDGRIPTPWSSAVKRDMPARVLNALSEFGLLGELRSGRRPVVPYRPADGTLVYLAYLLHFSGVTDASLAGHPIWALFGLEIQDVWNRLESLADEGWFIVQRAGQVVRVTWTHQNVKEAVDAIAGRDL